MVKLRQLLGSRREVVYECMYTKHKSQKRKVWHDGFLAIYDSRRVVLYEDQPPEGKVLDEAKMNPYEWDRKDEEYIDVPKFYVEVINETPIDVGGNSAPTATPSGLFEASAPETSAPAAPRVAARPGGLSRGPRKAAPQSKFKSPLASNGSAPPPDAAPYRPTHLAKRTASGMRKDISAAVDQFDFGRNPTSEWDYVPNRITRTPDEVAAIWFSDEVLE